MGEVYRARDTRLNRDVAIKVLGPGLSADPDRLARFEQEARASAALNHPNICAVFDIGVHDVLVFGSEPGRKIRGYIQDLDDGTRRAVTMEGATGVGVVSPDGTAFVTGGPDGRLVVYGADGGEPRPVPGSAPGETPGVQDEAVSRDVTVWHLLPHTSGWEGQVAPPDRGDQSLKTFVDGMATPMQLAPPGAAWSDNNVA